MNNLRVTLSLALLALLSGEAGAQTGPYQAWCADDHGVVAWLSFVGCWRLNGGGSGPFVATPIAPDRSYRLITQTYGGRIDIHKGLTEAECEHDRLKALNQPADEEEQEAAKKFAADDLATVKAEMEECGKRPSFCIHSNRANIVIASSDTRRAICEKMP